MRSSSAHVSTGCFNLIGNANRIDPCETSITYPPFTLVMILFDLRISICFFSDTSNISNTSSLEQKYFFEMLNYCWCFKALYFLKYNQHIIDLIYTYMVLRSQSRMRHLWRTKRKAKTLILFCILRVEYMILLLFYHKNCSLYWWSCRDLNYQGN